MAVRATHDAFIWDNSVICDHFAELSGTGETAYLLGDSGYPLREYLMTPVDGAAEDSPEGRYNEIQKRARSTIERTFGILKGRRRGLLAARELYYRPDTVGAIVVACSVLGGAYGAAGAATRRSRRPARGARALGAAPRPRGEGEADRQPRQAVNVERQINKYHGTIVHEST